MSAASGRTKKLAKKSAKVGKPFDAEGGRVMKGWIEVTREKADWVALAKEALTLARRAQR